MPTRRRQPPQLHPDDPRWLEHHLPFLARHLGAVLSGRAQRSGRELARRLQHARGRERARLIGELATLDAWAWRRGTSNAKTVAARERRIREALAVARRECPIREWDSVARRWRWRRARPI